MRTQAKTLSVFLKGSTSIHCYIKLSKYTCNISLRFDRGDAAQICGYPQSWAVHDTDLEPYNSESGTCEEAFEFNENEYDLKNFGYELYVSKETEIKILSKLKQSMLKQFADPTWSDTSTAEERKQALLKVDRAILKLRGDS